MNRIRGKHRTARRGLALLLALLCAFCLTAGVFASDSDPTGEQEPLQTDMPDGVPQEDIIADNETDDGNDVSPAADGAAEATPPPSPIEVPDDDPDEPEPQETEDEVWAADPYAAAEALCFCVGLLDTPTSVPERIISDRGIGAYTAAMLLRGVEATEETPAPAATSVPETTAPPSPVSTPEPQTRAEELLEGMSLREKVWQLIIVRPSDLDSNCVRTVTTGMRTALSQYPVGGIIFFATNMQSKDQVRTLLSDLQSASGIPLLMMCDEEGGTVSRLMRTVGTTKIGAMLSYKDMGTDTAYQNACTIASDMSALGFNMDLAPVADVRSNPQNTAIGTRAYSDSFTQAAELIPAAVRGFHDGGVACTLKHFPGHGDTTTDTHDGTTYVYKSLDDLRRGELLSFQAGIDAGADAVMIGHLTVPAVSSEPALFSYALVTELLRGEMGFNGIILTDALEMKALTDHYGTAEIAVRAIGAGVDMLLLPVDPYAAVDAIVAAVERGDISEARIDESVLRVLTLKESRGLL